MFPRKLKKSEVDFFVNSLKTTNNYHLRNDFLNKVIDGYTKNPFYIPFKHIFIEDNRPWLDKYKNKKDLSVKEIYEFSCLLMLGRSWDFAYNQDKQTFEAVIDYAKNYIKLGQDVSKMFGVYTEYQLKKLQSFVDNINACKGEDLYLDDIKKILLGLSAKDLELNRKRILNILNGKNGIKYRLKPKHCEESILFRDFINPIKNLLVTNSNVYSDLLDKTIKELKNKDSKKYNDTSKYKYDMLSIASAFLYRSYPFKALYLINTAFGIHKNSILKKIFFEKLPWAAKSIYNHPSDILKPKFWNKMLLDWDKTSIQRLINNLKDNCRIWKSNISKGIYSSADLLVDGMALFCEAWFVFYLVKNAFMCIKDRNKHLNDLYNTIQIIYAGACLLSQLAKSETCRNIAKSIWSFKDTVGSFIKECFKSCSQKITLLATVPLAMVSSNDNFANKNIQKHSLKNKG